MRLSITAVTAGFLAASQAVLLPPSYSTADVYPKEILEYGAPAEEFTLNLPCKNCPVFVDNPDGRTSAEGVESDLRLQFVIERDNVVSDILTLNGVQIYPTPMIAPASLNALQTTSDGRLQTVVPIGYELLSKPIMKSEKEHLDLVAIRLQIFEIGNEFVDGIESVEVKVLKSLSGMLLAIEVETAPTTNPGGKDCTTFICKLKTTFKAKLEAIKGLKLHKGCGKTSGHHGSSAPATMELHEGSYHHGPHKYHGLRKFLHALKSIAFHVLIPVFIGIAVGLTASILGMVVGHAVVLLWRAFHGGRQRGAYCRILLRNSVDEAHDDIKPFLDHQEPSPAYEDSLIDEKKTTVIDEKKAIL